MKLPIDQSSDPEHVSEYLGQLSKVKEIDFQIEDLKKQLKTEKAKALLLQPKHYVDLDKALHYGKCKPIKQGSK